MCAFCFRLEGAAIASPISLRTYKDENHAIRCFHRPREADGL